MQVQLNTNFNSLGTSVYPVGMESYNNYVNQGGYASWKGAGVNSNPVGIAPGHIRPLTNNDPGNVFYSPFGKARPLKHYRKGRTIPNVTSLLQSNFTLQQKTEANLISYNLNRQVKSSNGTQLGQGTGGGGLLSVMIDKPGSYNIKENTVTEINETIQSNNDCINCQGVGIVDTYYPNKTYLTNNPEQNTTNKILCCNEEKKALKRVVYANTNLKKNYYTTHFQYLQNRCKTYEQKVFNFKNDNYDLHSNINTSSNPIITQAMIDVAKPGSALAISNTYVANCQPNAEIYQASELNLVYSLLDLLTNTNTITKLQYSSFIKLNQNNLKDLYLFLKGLPLPYSTNSVTVFANFINNPYYGMPLSGPTNPNGCKLTVYKPNNPQFAVQGSVDCSTKTLKLNVTTIEKNAASYYRNSAGQIISKNNIANLVPSNIPFLYKNKPSTSCNAPSVNPLQNKLSLLL